MHTIKLSVSDEIYAQIVSLFQTFPSNELKVVEDTPSFVVSDVDEAKERVFQAEKNAKYIDHDEFVKEIDSHIDSL
ncbi:hypothetical protein FCU45_05900 [Sulfurimonas crateris]|uniref:Uncharacterized protein n=1 Tax=Sulfurimonas crateris TaxID=2574727 RepID=A0A4U2Z5X1_9BACT|nr:hypothetical protein [Sulfurimonas crateris]TKI69588.1 hypothetical protein FCU45_05900 [Sulfurimonas crateris]